MVLCLARRFDEARRAARTAIEIDSTYPPAYVYLSYACQGNGQFDEAIEAAEGASHLDNPFWKYATPGWIYGLAGRRQDALRMLDLLEQTAKRTYVSPNLFAWIYGGLGDGENWSRMMHGSLEERSGTLVYLKSAVWDNMRSHPFYAELVRKVGLPPDQPHA